MLSTHKESIKLARVSWTLRMSFFLPALFSFPCKNLFYVESGFPVSFFLLFLFYLFTTCPDIFGEKSTRSWQRNEVNGGDTRDDAILNHSTNANHHRVQEVANVQSTAARSGGVPEKEKKERINTGKAPMFFLFPVHIIGVLEYGAPVQDRLQTCFLHFHRTSAGTKLETG